MSLNFNEGRKNVVDQLKSSSDIVAKHTRVLGEALDAIAEKFGYSGAQYNMYLARLSQRLTEPESLKKEDFSPQLIDTLADEFVACEDINKERRDAFVQALRDAFANAPAQIAREKAFKENFSERQAHLNEEFSEVAAVVNTSQLRDEVKKEMIRTINFLKERELNTMPKDDTVVLDPVARFKFWTSFNVGAMMPQLFPMTIGKLSPEEERIYNGDVYPAIQKWAGEHDVTNGQRDRYN